MNWKSDFIVNPNDKQVQSKVDPTGCEHSWEQGVVSYMVAGVDDYFCSICKAHGWKRSDEDNSRIEYCHGGIDSLKTNSLQENE